MTDTIIPALPGYTVIYADGEELHRGEPVIAWAIDSERSAKGELEAVVSPITPEGEAASNRVGLEYPNNTVSILFTLFDSFDDAQDARREEFRKAEK